MIKKERFQLKISVDGKTNNSVLTNVLLYAFFGRPVKRNCALKSLVQEAQRYNKRNAYIKKERYLSNNIFEKRGEKSRRLILGYFGFEGTKKKKIEEEV